MKNTMGVISETGTVYPSGAPEFTPGFEWASCYSIFILYVCFVYRCLSFCVFPFGHCIFWSSSIYSDYPVGIFKLFLALPLSTTPGKWTLPLFSTPGKWILPPFTTLGKWTLPLFTTPGKWILPPFTTPGKWTLPLFTTPGKWTLPLFTTPGF